MHRWFVHALQRALCGSVHALRGTAHAEAAALGRPSRAVIRGRTGSAWRFALRLAFVLALASASGMPARAAAQVGGSRLHLGAGMALDFGGGVDFDRRTYAGSYDLRATPGLRGHLDYSVHRYISIGGMARMSWWRPWDFTGIGRSFLFDLAPRLTGHYDWRDFRFYMALAPGLTISAINDDGVGVENPAAGFTLSLTLAGMEWWFARSVGLFAELGWVGHWFTHSGEGTTQSLEVDLSQGLFELGFVFGV